MYGCIPLTISFKCQNCCFYIKAFDYNGFKIFPDTWFSFFDLLLFDISNNPNLITVQPILNHNTAAKYENSGIFDTVEDFYDRELDPDLKCKSDDGPVEINDISDFIYYSESENDLDFYYYYYYEDNYISCLILSLFFF